MSAGSLTRHRTSVDGIALAWSERLGDAHAQTIVFLHGLGASSRDFAWLADHRALSHERLMLIDMAGHGMSDRPDAWSYAIEAHADLIAELLHSTATGPVTLVGHSMGGSVAIALAHRQPEVISRLVVAEPALDPGTGTLSGYITRQSEERFVARGYPALVYQTQRAAERGDRVAATFLPSLQQASPIALHRSAASLRAHRSPTFREQLVRLALPKTMLWGERTAPLAPPLDDGAMHQTIIPAAGHQMMTDNPDAVATALSEALIP